MLTSLTSCMVYPKVQCLDQLCSLYMLVLADLSIQCSLAKCLTNGCAGLSHNYLQLKSHKTDLAERLLMTQFSKYLFMLHLFNKCSKKQLFMVSLSRTGNNYREKKSRSSTLADCCHFCFCVIGWYICLYSEKMSKICHWSQHQPLSDSYRHCYIALFYL